MKKDVVAIKNPDYDELLSIDITLANICNYSCHYCHPGLNNGDRGFPLDYDLYTKNFDHLINIYKNKFNKKHIKVELTGGEPTLWPRIADFAKHLKETHPEIDCCKIISNGSRTIRWWKENSQYFDEIHLSLHPEGNPQHVIEVADYIYKNTNNFVTINVILDPTDWETSKNRLDEIVAHTTPWLTKSWLLVSGATVRSDYTKEQLKEFDNRVKKIPPQEYIDKLRERGIIFPPSKATLVYDNGTTEPFTKLTLKREEGDNVFTGWECNTGVDRIACAFGNIISPCGARYLFDLDQPLTLYDEDFTKKFRASIIKPIICRESVCGKCTSDLRIPKRKI